MSFQRETIIKATRKPCKCRCCGSSIAVGSSCLELSGKWDGDFYSYRAHIDCRDMWNAAYKTYADPWEGMAWDLLEAIAGDESRAIKQACLDQYRGRFPHVVCRLELRLQREDLAGHDEHRSWGIEPFNEDQPEVYA